MPPKDLLSPDVLRKLFDYNPDTGLFLWRNRPISMFCNKNGSALRVGNSWNSRYAGTLAFQNVSKLGYCHCSAMGANLSSGRVAWAIHYGHWPNWEIDHINCLRSDNRISNLRQASRAENVRNTRKYKNNTSGVKGVSFHKSKGKYRAYISVEGKQFNLGYFHALEDAAAAYAVASDDRHGDFGRLE